MGSYHDFITRDCCGNWPQWLVTEYVVAANMITAAYFAVPAIMVFAYRERRSEPAEPPRDKLRLIIAYGLFFVFCGLGHQEKWLAFVWPNYYFFAHWEAATAIVSWWGVLESFRHRVALLRLL